MNAKLLHFVYDTAGIRINSTFQTTGPESYYKKEER